MTNFETLQRVVLAEAWDAIDVDNADKAQFLLHAFDVFDVVIDDQHLTYTNRQNAVSEHIANRFSMQARIPFLLDSLHQHFTASDLDYLAGDLIDALVEAEMLLTAANNAFKEHIVVNGGGVRITR